MNFLIVPDYLRDRINAAIDKALDGRPCESEEREMIFAKLLKHYDLHGDIPDFTLAARSPQ